MKKIDRLLKILSLTIVALFISIILLVWSLTKPANEEIIKPVKEQQIETVDDINPYETIFTKEEFSEYKKINSDYIGQVVFESKIINEPVVYSTVNSYYLRKNLEKKYEIQGTIYLDDRNTLSDQNLILYGHYTEPGFTDYEGYDPDVRPKFTNLDLLLNKDNYEDNKTVYLFLENEVRVYEVVSVYYCPLLEDEEGNYVYVTEGYEYYLTEYSDDIFDTYKKTIIENQRYDTNNEFNNDFNFLTLQTCVAKTPNLREIVLCKEIKVDSYK